MRIKVWSSEDVWVLSTLVLKTFKSDWDTDQAHMKSARMAKCQLGHSGWNEFQPEWVNLQEDYWSGRTP